MSTELLLNRFFLASPFLALCLLPATSRADLFVTDGDMVDRFNATTGAVIQTNGQNAFANVVSATGVAIGPDKTVYIANTNPGADANLSVVNHYNAATGQVINAPFIPFANGPSQLDGANGMAFGPGGNLYVADELDDGSVKVFSPSGTYLTKYVPTGGNAEAVAFDPQLPNDLFVATGSTIEDFNLTTHADNITVQGSSSSFSNGSDLDFGPDGKLYVLDISSSSPQILRFNADGTGQTVFTDFNSASFSPAVFQPADMAFGPDGLLYVSGLDFNSLNPDQGEIVQLTANGSFGSDLVTGLSAPGFLAFTPVPEPAMLPIIAGTSLLLLGRRRIPRLD